jgi:hypothetical protein
VVLALTPEAHRVELLEAQVVLVLRKLQYREERVWLAEYPEFGKRCMEQGGRLINPIDKGMAFRVTFDSIA